LARAETIEFLPESKEIQLKTNASLSKDGTLITGDSIYYDIANETWRAKGDNQSNQKRIQLVIPPLEKIDKPSPVTYARAREYGRIKMTMLSANHLSKSYAKRPVVKDVSFSVNEGEVVGLLGPNGAGKTTCFYMTTGLVTQDGGQIILDDEDITESPMHGRARKGLGYLPQEPSIFRKLSVRDNILAILETRKRLNSFSAPAKIRKPA
jgi:ABC-type multidrug transport system fused ATPase/permease subunit